MIYKYTYYDDNGKKIVENVDKAKAIALLSDCYIDPSKLVEIGNSIYPLLFSRLIEVIQE